MIKGHSVLAIIPARGGSKGVPGKNIRPLGGKPLLHWTIEAAQQSQYLDHIILSSDDPAILDCARDAGCEVPFQRPAELAADDTPGIDPVVHALQSLDEEYDLMVLLQPTSPFRTAVDIDQCLERCVETEADGCVSVMQADPHPYWSFSTTDSGRMQPLLEEAPARRQDLPEAYTLNGAVYVSRVPVLLEQRRFITDNTVACVMPKERSLDIDEAWDFQLAEALVQSLNNASHAKGNTHG